MKGKGPAGPRPSAAQDTIVDSSPSSASDEQDACAATSPGRSLPLPEPIEPASSFAGPSPTPEAGPELADERAAKRRRVSVSPDIQTSSPPASVLPSGSDRGREGEEIVDSEDPAFSSGEDENDGGEDGATQSAHLARSAGLPASLSLSGSDSAGSGDEDHSHEELDTDEDDEADANSDPESSLPNPKSHHGSHGHPQPSHPIFRRAPRFKSPSADRPAGQADLAGHPPEHYLPDAFSPHHRRRGRYVPGGLAAELRDWLVQVKGCGPEDGGDGARGSAALAVERVRRGGAAMTLVEGRAGEGGALRLRAILAGQGRVSGLEKPRAVPPGCTVLVAPPAWDVHLDVGGEGVLQRWTVACDWGFAE